ncbi:MAG: hypothetical protein WA634_15400 [Silvibacterium sp.]
MTLAQATAACGPQNIKFNVKTDHQPPSFEPNPDKAIVIMDESFAAAGNGFVEPTLKVGLDGKWIGATRSNSWYAFPVEPGEHHLCINWQSHLGEFSHLLALSSLNAEPGKVYYFRSRIISLGKVPILDLDPINEDQGRYLALSSSRSIAKQK